MKPEDERITELLFALRRDFRISKEIIDALSKIGPEVIPYLINAYKIDDFAFRLRIIEALGKMGHLGFIGLIELLNHADAKTKITILKTVRKMDDFPPNAGILLLESLEKILDWEQIKYTNEQELADIIDNILQYRDNLVKTFLSVNQLTKNNKRIEEIAFITTHLYLRKILTMELKYEMKNLYTKLKKNEAISIPELEEIYKTLYKLDPKIELIISEYLQSQEIPIKQEVLEKFLEIVRDQLSRIIIYKNCERIFYQLNYDSDSIKNYANHSFYLGLVHTFNKKQLDKINNITLFDDFKGVIVEMKRDLDYELEDIPIRNLIGETGGFEAIKIGLVNLDLSSRKLTSINLEPLAECKNLEYLNLSDNQLQTIDLSPLSHCENLQHLELSRNQLVELDLSPLLYCENLQWLNLAKNQLSSIDLSPLANNWKLIDLGVTDNKLEDLDITALENCKDLEFFEVDESTKLLWHGSKLPEESKLPVGLQEYYSLIELKK
ncbi:MAG: hypothetical protein JXA54_01760 [Candidatus Heimdallarchaeota archaeon]|nr:hypothetical protein [Candidatus Heimdallarchaeota archaeon]